MGVNDLKPCDVTDDNVIRPKTIMTIFPKKRNEKLKAERDHYKAMAARAVEEMEYMREDRDTHRAEGERLREIATKNEKAADALWAERDRIREDRDQWARMYSACTKREQELLVDLRALREVLTPSAETKAVYMGEFVWTDKNGIEHMVPWTTIKEIMAAIRERATLKGDSDET